MFQRLLKLCTRGLRPWLALAVLAGCSGRGPVTAPVRGTVTLDGKPLKLGTVIFIPESAGPYASGEIGPDGAFSLTTVKPGDGAILGTHRIMINAYEAANPELPPAPLVPFRYASEQTSGLTAVVKADTENVVELNLKSHSGRR